MATVDLEGKHMWELGQTRNLSCPYRSHSRSRDEPRGTGGPPLKAKVVGLTMVWAKKLRTETLGKHYYCCCF